MKENFCIRQQADIQQLIRCSEQVSSLNHIFEFLSECLSLAGNNARLKILFLLNQEERLCVCDLGDILGLTVSAVSQHLKKLKDRKLIYSERDAQTIFYSISDEYQLMLIPFFATLNETALKQEA